MKKLIAILLAALLVVGMTTAALADDYTDQPTAKFTVTYTATNGGSNTETFKFSDFTCTSVTDGGVLSDGTVVTATTAPTITKLADVTLTTGGSQEVTITLPTFDAVGIYTYEFKEIIPETKTAGVTYYKAGTEQTMKLVVTVVQEGTLKRIAAVHVENGSTSADKTGVIANTYESGTLAVKKIVAGNMGDQDKPFNITVTFTAASGEAINSEISYTGAQTGTVSGNSVQLTLKHDQTVTFTNIPEGVTWKVEEADYSGDGYTTEYSTQQKLMAGGNNDTCDVTNTKTGTVDTGIVLDTLPYVLIAVAVMAAVVVMIAKKRRVED